MPAAASTRSSLSADLARLGVRPGDLLMVHAGIRSMGEVKGGVNVVVQALFDAIAHGGTLAAYVDFEPFFEDGDEAGIPVFDKRIAHAARDHGVLHETLRNWPGALRSDHPDAGVAAIGPLADWLTSNHPLPYGYGEGTPFERILDARGRVLMLGAPLDTITLLHYAEHKARIPGKRIRRYRRHMPLAQAALGSAWIDIEEFDTSEPVHDALPSNCFELIANDYLATGRGRQGHVGAARSVLFEGADLVTYGIAWIENFVNSRSV